MNGAFRGKLLSLLNLHLGGAALLLGLNLYLAVSLFFAWRAAGSSRQDEISQAQITYAQLQVQNRRLAGLPIKVDQARTGADAFYKERIPPTYSAMLSELGALSQQSGIHLTRLSYTQTPAIADLAEIRIDGNMSGEYTAIMRFINSVERDKMFFVIDTLTLTGQQAGLVNLRLRMTTYLHASDAGGIPLTDAGSDQTMPKPQPQSPQAESAPDLSPQALAEVR